MARHEVSESGGDYATIRLIRTETSVTDDLSFSGSRGPEKKVIWEVTANARGTKSAAVTARANANAAVPLLNRWEIELRVPVVEALEQGGRVVDAKAVLDRHADIARKYAEKLWSDSNEDAAVLSALFMHVLLSKPFDVEYGGALDAELRTELHIRSLGGYGDVVDYDGDDLVFRERRPDEALPVMTETEFQEALTAVRDADRLWKEREAEGWSFGELLEGKRSSEPPTGDEGEGDSPRG